MHKCGSSKTCISVCCNSRKQPAVQPNPTGLYSCSPHWSTLLGVVLQQSAVWLERLKLRLFANPIIRHFVNLATVQYAFAFISKLFDTTVIIINR